MSNWDSTPAVGGDSWGGGGGDTAPAGDGFDSTSQNGNGGNAGGDDSGCRICHADSHFARDCPDMKDRTSGCFNCGEEGHSKAECTNPAVEREFTGNCNFCFKDGHRRADCPDAPAQTCKTCGMEGHKASECSSNRVFAKMIAPIPEGTTASELYEKLKVADKEKDSDDFKEAFLQYACMCPDMTLPQFEQEFRAAEFNFYLIAKEQETSLTHTRINLQDEHDQKFSVSFQLSTKPNRKKFAAGWPKSPEQNMERLKEAGFVIDSGIPLCDNCRELGHVRAKCPEEKREIEEVKISCVLCNEEGHRARDCTEPRRVREPKTCRNCGEEGHKASECEKERVIICRNCDEEGHTGKECDKPRDMSRVQCRNCDEMGHTGRDCAKPTDWSRVKCSRCEEMGHSYKRCPKPEEELGGKGGFDNDEGGAAVTGGDGGEGGWGGGDTSAAW